MRILFDTNIILDVLLKREPWVRESGELWRANDENRISGYIIASAFTDIFYIARRLTDIQRAQTAIQICLDAFEVCPVGRDAIEKAASMPGRDFEDNLMIASAELVGLDIIATRNKRDFIDTSIAVMSPSEILKLL